MRRIAKTEDSQAVSLFPFLAVLLSTMGALLLVLVVMARQARLQAAHGERDDVASLRTVEGEATTDVSATALSELESTAERLAAIRDAGTKELENSRLRLRHADQHLRKLQDDVARLYEQVRSLEEIGNHRLEDREQAARELTRLDELIRDTEAQLEEQRRRAAAAPRSYAIVPYEGPHGTRRRPLYIECRHDAVILQPEGVELAVGDFQGPLGPGNPLASALRAAEEYYVASSSNGASGDSEEKPYPLVLVRPDGIAAYYHVRRALEGWGSEFGYELLDGEWQLEFPLPNPQVANVQQRAINLARARQQALAIAAPRRFGGGGGFGGSHDGTQAGLFGGLDPALPEGYAGGDGGGWGEGQSTSGQGASRYASAISNHMTSAAPPFQDPTARGNADSWGSGPPAGGERDGNPHLNGTAPSGAASGSGMDRRTISDGAGATSTAEQIPATGPGGEPQGSRYGQPGSAPTSVRGNGSAAGTAPGGAPGQVPGAEAQTPGNMNSAGQRGSSFGASTVVQPLAEVRGADWAVPEARLGAVPVRRTVQVIIRGDRLAVLPDLGATGGRVIPVTDSIQAAVDPFVEVIQQRIRDWGTAGSGLYWRPILVFKPGPDGGHHAEALRGLLMGSGLEVAP